MKQKLESIFSALALFVVLILGYHTATAESHYSAGPSAGPTVYAVLCGPTTAGGNLQSIASVGTATQVLTSNGAGALPSFQDAGGGGGGIAGSGTVGTIPIFVTNTTTVGDSFLTYDGTTFITSKDILPSGNLQKNIGNTSTGFYGVFADHFGGYYLYDTNGTHAVASLNANNDLTFRSQMDFVPGMDNTYQCGKAALRWSEVNAVTVHADNTAKAWATFNYIGSVVNILDSVGVTSITRTASGRYKVTFTAAFSNTYYTIDGSGECLASIGKVFPDVDHLPNRSTTVADIYVLDNGGTPRDPTSASDIMSAYFFGH